jgi:uncharacterized protein DUF262/uncharacterized protein DUF1524
MFANCRISSDVPFLSGSETAEAACRQQDETALGRLERRDRDSRGNRKLRGARGFAYSAVSCVGPGQPIPEAADIIGAPMKPDTYTVQELFERDVQYVVPLYQRPYVWNEEHQWAPLWDDMSALLQHQENGDGSAVWSHFLGAIVLDQEHTAPGQIPRYTVIDGQQRLTTLQLLLAAAAKELEAVGAADDAAWLRELAMNNPRKAEGAERLKVWPTNANRVAFQAVMSPDGLPEGHVNDPGNLIDETFDYFCERTAEYLTGVDEDSPPTARAADGSAADGLLAERAQRLRITLCDLLKVVSITLEADDNPQVIFETLNARGTPLLALDLVKNAIFHLAARQERDTDRLYEEVWAPQLDDDYWRQERRQGRLNRPVGELFLMHWLTMRLEKVIPATELFSMFRTRILSADTDAEGLIRELCADAAVMRSFDSSEPKSPEAEFFNRMAALDAGTMLPIVLLLFRSPQVSVERRRRALRILESWLARRVLMRLTAKNYNQFAPRLVARMKADLEHADDALLAGLSGGEGEISRWPEDGEFIEFLRTVSLYGTVSQPRLVMALAAAETSLYSNKTDLPEIATSLSLEHLMPQTWETYWPLVDSHGDELDGNALEEASAERWKRIGRLGNLTIVTSRLNSGLSNGAWPHKRKALNAESKLLLNARLAEEETWDEAAIDERGVWLADVLAKTWPGPGAENWQS